MPVEWQLHEAQPKELRSSANEMGIRSQLFNVAGAGQNVVKARRIDAANHVNAQVKQHVNGGRASVSIERLI